MKKILVILIALLVISCAKDEIKETETDAFLNNNCKRVFQLEYYKNKVYAYLITEDEWNSLSEPGLHNGINPIKIEVTGMSPMPKLGGKICE